MLLQVQCQLPSGGLRPQWVLRGKSGYQDIARKVCEWQYPKTEVPFSGLGGPEKRYNQDNTPFVRSCCFSASLWLTRIYIYSDLGRFGGRDQNLLPLLTIPTNDPPNHEHAL